MSNFIARFAGLATLALAALPAAALSTNAHTAPAPAARQIAQLDSGAQAALRGGTLEKIAR